ncbi:transglutaminase-like domain-containing protein [Paenibacillus sp. N4]|uniref:transglutaminase domain-containing protein n=1 Tax=Paenibacillus vietnamensis TaxID=2590547 RepID=UPI001CD14BEA|nr:transglutaminase-like domain-containing protein [Paenibacillus vietnamensis]MCA0755558.1 transglutaminase-like domain-containing protein [Paenibacillus vietnamensis]
MDNWIELFRKPEPIALIVAFLLLGSLVQGMMRGASGSARRLFFFVWEAVAVVVCLVLAGQAAKALSPVVSDWLRSRVAVPMRELNAAEQAWYTFLTSMRDFALLRYGVLFLLGYLLLRSLAAMAEPLLARLLEVLLRSGKPEPVQGLPGRRSASRAVGALIGAAHGAGRALVFVALLFVYVSLVPSGWYTDKITDSPLYAEAADWLEPVAGGVLEGQGPVLAEAVQSQFQQILQRKYEMIDYNIPAEIEQAALYVTKDASTKEEKARRLYDWLGTRIAYDWDKANNYVQNGVWKEQTPPETFDTRKGVCIDIARLYAVMARAAGLEVKVVTGMGADGRGGYGPHAWNEVQIGNGDGGWIPLDATWASSGDWFNPPRFEETHIREA